MMKTATPTSQPQDHTQDRRPSPSKADFRAALIQALHHVELTAPEYVVADVLTDDLFPVFCDQSTVRE